MIKSEKIHTLMSQCNPCVMCRINPHYCHTHGACNILRAWVSLCDEIERLEKGLDKAIASRNLVDDCPPKHDGCQLDEKANGTCDKCWKEWCMNGTEFK